MKITDYCPRAAPFDSYLAGADLLGVEIGVDVGAHAEAMLTYCDIKFLYLIDIWDNPQHFGYCKGRLETKSFKSKIKLIAAKSHQAVTLFEDGKFDFVYCDQLRDYKSVRTDLEDWWPKLKVGGVMGFRNYVDGGSAQELVKAVDEFVKLNKIETKIETGEIILFKK